MTGQRAAWLNRFLFWLTSAPGSSSDTSGPSVDPLVGHSAHPVVVNLPDAKKDENQNVSGLRWTIAVSAVAAAMLLRQLLVSRGIVVGDDRIRLLTLGLFGTASLIVLLTLRPISATSFFAAVAAFVSLFSAVQLLLPVGGDAAAPAACPGAQVNGVDFQATSTETGVSVRNGPGRSYDQTNRFLGSCSIGFVGYCLGEPTTDLLILEVTGAAVKDARWLKLPNGDGFVAASVVRVQGSDDDLGTADGDCPDPDEHSIAPAKFLDLQSQVDGEIMLKAEAPGAATVGFAALTREPAGQLRITRIALDSDSSEGFEATWDSGQVLASLDVDTTQVLLVTASCTAAESRGDGSSQLVRVGSGTSPEDDLPPDLAALDPAIADRLLRTACLLPGD